MLDLGTVIPGSTIRIPFSTFKGSDGSSLTMTNFSTADILVYKDGSTTERASTSGYTATTDFDTKTGKQLIVIDLSDNTTADFWAAGSEYLVAVDAVTVDAVTTGGWVARFRIGYRDAILDTTIATLSSQTSFTLAAGPADNSALIGCVALVHDAASAVQRAIGVVSAYTGSTLTVTLAADPGIFTMAAKDNISFFVPGNTKWYAQLSTSKVPLAPATAGRDLVVDSAGLADSNVVKIGPTGSGVATTAALGTNLKTMFDTDYATLYDSTNKAFTIKIGNFAMGGSSLVITYASSQDFTSTQKTSVETAVWESNFALGAGTAGTAGRYIRDIQGASFATSGLVADASASTTVFKTNLADATNFWNDCLVTFTSGALAGQTKPILSYSSTNGTITLDEALTSAPANGVAFSIIRTHVHPVSQIQSGLATSSALSGLITTVGVDGLGLSAIPKTGYKLASDGLDSISTTAPSGVASNFREMLVQVWRRFFKRVTKDATQIKTYADDATTVVTTQAYTSSTTDDVGAAS